MKKIIKLSIVLVALMISSPIYALVLPLRAGVDTKVEAKAKVKADLLENKEEKKIENQEKKEERKELKQIKREEKKAKAKDRRPNKVVKFSVQMTRVHQAAVDRLNKLVGRINSRITKLEAEKSIKLDDAKTKLADARVKIVAAQTYVNSIGGQVATITATGTPQVALESIRGLFVISRANLKVAHQALVDVISSIKLGLGIKAEKNATSTATTTP